jgi:hypothetical protein
MTVSRELGFRCRAQKARAGWEPGGNRLGLAEREEISLALARGETFTAVAAGLGRSVSTVSREVAANGGRVGYRAAAAHGRAFERARRPKAARLSDPGLAQLVSGWLLEFWSPLAIARRLRIEFPCDPMMWVSHETIYQSLFVQGRSELRRELARCLRSGRTQRRPHGRRESRGRLAGMVLGACRASGQRPPTRRKVLDRRDLSLARFAPRTRIGRSGLKRVLRSDSGKALPASRFRHSIGSLQPAKRRSWLRPNTTPTFGRLRSRSWTGWRS